MKNLALIILLSLLVHLQHTQAQETINIGYNGMSFESFATELNNSHATKLFFKKEWVKDISLQKSYANSNINDILTDILSGTNINFVLRENYIVLVKGINLNNTDLKESTESVNYVDPSELDEINYSKLKEEEFKIHNIGTPLGKRKIKLFGYVSHYETNSPIKSVEIFLPNLSKGVITDSRGYYELELDQGRYTLNYKFMGLRPTVRKINLRGDGRLDVKMTKESQQISEVKVTAKDDKVKRTTMGVEYIKMEEVHSLPTALGEPDIIKSTTMLPGVESTGEGTVGFNVRGGSADQNLILIDNAPIYYPAHFFGFFSPFNSDIIQEASLYKSSIPTKFGGRISSTYDIHTHDKITEKFHGKLGISPVTSKVYTDIPVVKNKLSLINSFRFTYSEWVLDKIDSKELINSSADFYDVHSKVIYSIGKNDYLDLNFYKSKDEFQLHSDTIYEFNNQLASINWRHRFSEKLKMMNSMHMSDYSYEMSADEIQTNAFKLKHGLSEKGVKTVWDYEKNLNLNFQFGGGFKYYSIDPGEIKANADSSLIAYKNIESEKAIESSVFAGIETTILPKLNFEGGLRYSLYGNVGNRNELQYANNEFDNSNATDTIQASGFRNTYHGAELRLNLSYELSNSSSIKASYNKNRQYIHLLSNTTSISPTDTWKLSDKYMKPQIGDQYSIGYYKNLNNATSEFSVEAYYKFIKKC